MTSNTPKYRPRIVDIEALRTIAIAFVMIEHAFVNLVFHPVLLPTALSYGQLWPGVDLFFVISGFLVTGDLLRRFDRGLSVGGRWAVIKAFWLRRAWRLWPTAWLWLLIIVIVSAVVDPPYLGPLDANISSTEAGVFFYANYWLPNRISALSPYGASYPYWSLSLEEQFYFIFPLLIPLLGRGLPAVILLALAMQLPLAHNTYYFFFRFDGLLWGAALAMWSRTSGYERSEPNFMRPRWVGMSFLVLLLFCLFRWAGVGNVTPPFEVGGIAAISALLVWVASYNRDYLCPKPARAFVLWAGSRSYSFYVAHIPIFQCSAALAHHFFTPESPLWSGAGDRYAVIIGAVLLLTSVELTHRFVERPLRAIGSRLAGHTIIATHPR